MKIAINTRLLIKNKLEGIGWFTFETMKRITRNHPEHEFFFLFDRKPHPDFLFSTNITPVVLQPPARHPFLWYLWFEFSVARFLKKNKIELFVSTDGFIPLNSKTPSIAVIHDINFYHFPEWIPFLVRKYYNWFFPKFAQQAASIVTVSEYSKNDIAKCFNVDLNKITVAHNGANLAFEPITEDEKNQVKEKYSKGNPYFVFVGALNPRKNVASLLKAFDIFIDKTKLDYSLVIVGEPMFMTDDITQALKGMKHKNLVEFSGRLQVNELRMVMGGATALVFVPYFEGFGIPMVEAMYCHVPIIASNKTAMPEVAGDAAYYVDPYNISSIADAMEIVATDHKLREALAAKAEKRKELFTWDNTANKLYECMEKLITDIKKV